MILLRYFPQELDRQPINSFHYGVDVTSLSRNNMQFTEEQFTFYNIYIQGYINRITSTAFIEL